MEVAEAKVVCGAVGDRGCVLTLADKGGEETISRDCPQPAGFPQHPPPVLEPHPPAPVREGQSLHGPLAATDLLIAAQNAFPKASSAQAAQFDGSPVQEGPATGLEEDTGKTTFDADLPLPRRRRGTGGWYAGRLSRMDAG